MWQFMLVFTGLVLVTALVFPSSIYYLKATVGIFIFGGVLIFGLIGIKDENRTIETTAAEMMSVFIWGLLLTLLAYPVSKLLRLVAPQWEPLERLYQLLDAQPSFDTTPNKEKPGPPLKAHSVASLVMAKAAVSMLDETCYVIKIRGAIDSTQAEQIRDECRLAIKSSYQRVCVDISSQGGEVASLFIIRSLIQELNQRKPVYILATGICESAAIGILLSVPVDQRLCLKYTSFMIHCAKNERGIESPSTQLINQQLIDLYLEETQIEEASLRALFKSRRDYAFSSQEAQRLGIVGAVL